MTTPEQEREREAVQMYTCPYFQGTGTCVSGCYDEPACYVNAGAEDEWADALPDDFDKATFDAEIERQRDVVAMQRWLDAEKLWLERLTLEPMTETGVYPLNPASPQYARGHRFAAYHKSDGGASTHWCPTREEAEQELVKCDAFIDRFWDEKVTWRENDSMTTERIKSQQRMALVIGGQHFVPRYLGLRPHESSNHKGFAGRVMRWRLLGDPDATVYETDSMYTQGVVPERYLDRLPDNAEWV